MGIITTQFKVYMSFIIFKKILQGYNFFYFSVATALFEIQRLSLVDNKFILKVQIYAVHL